MRSVTSAESLSHVEGVRPESLSQLDVQFPTGVVFVPGLTHPQYLFPQPPASGHGGPWC